MIKRGIAVVLVLFLVGLVAGCGGDKKAAAPAAKGEYKAQLKLATLTTASHTYNLGANKFAELVKERSKGRIEVKVYPDGQLGKGERELLEGLQQGTIDIYVGSTGPIGNFSQITPLVQKLGERGGTAMIEVVRTPSCCRTATKPTTSTKFRAIEPAKVCKVTSGAPRRG